MKGGRGEGNPGNRDKPLWEYTKRRQATVVEWVALLPIFKVCAKETGYKDRGRVRGQWCCQTAAQRQLKTTLKEILAAAW